MYPEVSLELSRMGIFSFMLAVAGPPSFSVLRRKRGAGACARIWQDWLHSHTCWLPHFHGISPSGWRQPH